jgi:hypothetical protein
MRQSNAASARNRSLERGASRFSVRSHVAVVSRDGPPRAFSPPSLASVLGYYVATCKLSRSSTAGKDGSNASHLHETSLELEVRTRAMYGNMVYTPIVETRELSVTCMSIDRRLVF